MLDDMHQIHVHIMRLQRRCYRIYGKNVSARTMMKHITKLKKRTKPHWNQLLSQVVQDVVLRMGKTYDQFLKGKSGRPHIKPQHKYNSMTWTPAEWTLEGNRIKINCIDTWFSFHKHREITGIIKTITIKRDRCGDYWICFVCENSNNPRPMAKTGKSAGFDFGLKTFITCSDGSPIESPQFLKRSLAKLRVLNKSVSRKRKGSGNWWRAIRALSRQHRKITKQRLDWQWKLANDLCRRFDTLCFETLNIDGMKRLWGRKVSDLAFYQFIQILKSKCIKHDREFLQIGQWTATTKPCSNCGHKNDNLTLDDRQWICTECGSHHDRDINAAINIITAGLAANVEQT